MAKPGGARCNLDCEYCFYLEKETLYQAIQAMPDDMLQHYVRSYIAAQPGDFVTFAWQGGEPTLLGIDFFRRAVALQQTYANGKTVVNAFQTNGVLLDEEWCEFFKDNDFLVGISIDGPQRLHDRYRVNKGARGSFKQVRRGVDLLRKHGVEFNTLTVLHKHNADDPVQLYRFLKGIGSRFHQYIPIVERHGVNETEAGLSLVSPAFAGTARVTEWSLTPEQYGRFLTDTFDEWVHEDVDRVSVQIFDSTLSSWIGGSASLCVFAETCGHGLAMEHNGDLYACDHYVYPDHRLGNIMEGDLRLLVDGDRQTAFGRAKADKLPRQCIECDVRFSCNGGCPKHRIAKTAGGEPGLNYFCAAYKRFFHHCAPHMRYIAHRLAHGGRATDVMVWARARDRGFPGIRIGRNDTCPCGSGRKFKKCCGPLRL
ncbi:MAG: anaerobic sulfatase maturase [Hyphomicrobiales bacterium]|nr:anaerobic sulfatase maturase [Hyphomicrobiales bacterium]MCP4998805.1 anaerobic sulfatase maturase [Hyphomicrobiales bacterium]